jgi:hypothetical protein
MLPLAAVHTAGVDKKLRLTVFIGGTVALPLCLQPAASVTSNAYSPAFSVIAVTPECGGDVNQVVE